MNKILVTGANGFLGANAAITLYRKGYDVRIMVRKNACLKSLEGLPCEIYHGNIDNHEDVLHAVKGCDAVVHSASVTAQWGVALTTYTNINIIGTQHIINACIDQNIKRLVYISTANTFAPGTKKFPGNELGGFTLFSANSPYINTKYIAQQKVLESVITKKLSAVVINPTFMIGANDNKPSSGQIILHGINKRVVFYPPGGKNFVHVQDVCNCIVAALGSEANGQAYLAAGENLSYKEFFKMVNTISGQKPIMIKIPSAVLKMAGLGGTFLGKIFKKRMKLNYASAKLLCINNYYSGNKSTEHYNIKYQPVNTAIKDALDWYRANKYC